MGGEQRLDGGNASGAVHRVGDTVRKPWSDSTPAVVGFMEALRGAGVDVPAPLGRDVQGRQVIEFIPGELAITAAPLSLPELGRVGAMVRSIHDASEAYTPRRSGVWHTAIPAPGDELVCHNDLGPWNLVLGERWVFIDWDASAPSTRLWDLAYAAQAFTLSDTSKPSREAGEQLAAFVDGYGADDDLRAELPAVMHRRASAMYELLKGSYDAGVEPWGTMFLEGHGDHWRTAAEYVERHEATWSRVLTRLD